MHFFSNGTHLVVRPFLLGAEPPCQLGWREPPDRLAHRLQLLVGRHERRLGQDRQRRRLHCKIKCNQVRLPLSIGLRLHGGPSGRKVDS